MPQLRYRRPWLYKKQLDAIFCPERYALIEASTKAGKTTGCLVWALEQTMKLKPGQVGWWVAPIFAQAKIAYRRAKRGLPRGLFTANDSEMAITLITGGCLQFKSGDNADSLFGEDVHFCVVDEASRVQETAFHAIRSTLTATNGPCRMIGNIKGRKNWFFRLARRAEAGEKDMKYSKLIAADAVAAGVLSAEEVENARLMLPEPVFRELYLAEPSDDGGNPFGLKAIEDCFSPWVSADVVCFGVDLAKSVDWTWIIGLDAENRTALSERWQAPWDVTTKRLTEIIGQKAALIDSTGVGDPIVEDLQKTCFRVEGFKFTAPSKQQLMEGLAADIHKRLIRYHDPRLKLELENFEYEYTQRGVRYSAPAGFNDDGVMAIALARQKARTYAPSILDSVGPYNPMFDLGIGR